jgi:hypothetical protein
MLSGLPYENYLSFNPLCQSFKEDSLVGPWLADIINNFSALSTLCIKRKPKYSIKPTYENRTKVI